MTLGERIRKTRLEKKISQQTIADALGVTRSSVSQWEKGKNDPSSDKYRLLAEVLGVSPDWLISGGYAHSSIDVGALQEILEIIFETATDLDLTLPGENVATLAADVYEHLGDSLGKVDRELVLDAIARLGFGKESSR